MIIRDFSKQKSFGDVEAPVLIDTDPTGSQVPVSIDVSTVDVPTTIPASILISDPYGTNSLPSTTGTASSSTSYWTDIMRALTPTPYPAALPNKSKSSLATGLAVAGAALLGGLLFYKVAQ